MWSRATKIKVLVGLLAAWVLIMGLGIWLAVRSGKLPETAGRVARSLVESMPDAEQAKQELEAEVEKIRVAGEPMTLEEIIPPEVPDEENAALVYQDAFEKLNISDEDEDALSDLLSSMARPQRREARWIGFMPIDFPNCSGHEESTPRLSIPASAARPPLKVWSV